MAKKPKKQYKVEIIDDLCKGCSLCVDNCPKDLLFISDRINGKGYRIAQQTADYQECNGCSICHDMCPDSAIKIYYKEKPTLEGRVE